MLQILRRPRLSTGMLGPWQVSDYRRLLSSSTLWWQSFYMETIIVGWLVLEITNSVWAVAFVGFCRSAPFLLIGSLSGLMADRLGRRRTVVTMQTINALIYAAIVLLLLLGQIALWHLIVSSLLLGAAWAFDWPTRRSLVPDLVGRGMTVDAMMLENLGQGVARTVGPFLAGWLLAAAGALGGYGALAASSLISLLLLRSLSARPLEGSAPPDPAGPWRQIRDGLGYVGRNQAVLAVVLITMIMNVLVFPYMALLPVFARDVLGQGPLGLGLLGAGSGVGSFVGIYLIQRIRHRFSPGWIFTIGTIGQSIALLAFALSTFYPLSWAMLVVVGIGQACFGIMQSSIVLLSTSDEMRGRAMGALVLAIGAGPLGKLLTGGLAEGLGAPVALGGQAILAACGIVLVALCLPRVRRPL